MWYLIMTFVELGKYIAGTMCSWFLLVINIFNSWEICSLYFIWNCSELILIFFYLCKYINNLVVGNLYMGILIRNSSLFACVVVITIQSVEAAACFVTSGPSASASDMLCLLLSGHLNAYSFILHSDFCLVHKSYMLTWLVLHNHANHLPVQQDVSSLCLISFLFHALHWEISGLTFLQWDVLYHTFVT